ncbi:hypothetical protein THRCLA_02652 [Thraustotheca clavata]|uniref:Zinc finger PHD-type domain-containing protein n=1 Tax=Thraustotheca clavata TaxID=74557 RepID=A0A1W0A4F8_9STRA|nr:hypothetical protein THRCLA_02652 [Thraustotheca clavata]
MNSDLTGIIRGFIQQKLLVPGEKKLFVSYYRKKIYADVRGDGTMVFENRRYMSPAALALAMKRGLNPGLKSDPGWVSLYATDTGECLKDIREVWIARTAGNPPAAASQATVRSRIVEQPPARELCSLCGLDRGQADSCIKCDACSKHYHRSCATQACSSTSYYCKSCIDQHCDIILNLLQDLREVMLKFIPQREEDQVNASATEENTVNATVNNQNIDIQNGQAENASSSESNVVDNVIAAFADPIAEKTNKKPVASGAIIQENNKAVEVNNQPVQDANAASEPAAAVPSTNNPVEDVNFDMEANTSDFNEPNAAKTTEVQTPTESEATESTVSSEVFCTEKPQEAAKLVPVSAKKSTPLTKATILLKHIDTMIRQLQNQDERLNILMNSTGEVLVHLARLDFSTALKSIDEELAKVVESCARPNDANEENFSPGIEGLIKVLNLRHGILSAKYHFKQTSTALETLAEKLLRSCDAREQKIEESWQKDLKAHEDIKNKLQTAKGDATAIQTELSHYNALIDHAVRQRKTLRALNLSKRFIPAYRECTADLKASSDHLLVTIVADKLKGLTKSLKKWEHMDTQFTEMKTELISRKEKLKRSAPDASPISAVLPALKLAKTTINLPSPPLIKLIDRQIVDLDVNLANIQRHKNEAMETLKTIESAMNTTNYDMNDRILYEPTEEWNALLATMRSMISRCQPARPAELAPAELAPAELVQTIKEEATIDAPVEPASNSFFSVQAPNATLNESAPGSTQTREAQADEGMIVIDDSD